MGTLWRSETMEPIQLFLQLEGAHDTVDELSKVGMIQYKEYDFSFSYSFFFLSLIYQN